MEDLSNESGLAVKKEMISPKLLLIQISEDSGIPIRDILSKSRSAYLCKIRVSLCAKLRALGLSYPEIGEFIGRDHTTVVHNVKNASDQDFLLDEMTKEQEARYRRILEDIDLEALRDKK